MEENKKQEKSKALKEKTNGSAITKSLFNIIQIEFYEQYPFQCTFRNKGIEKGSLEQFYKRTTFGGLFNGWLFEQTFFCKCISGKNLLKV